MTGHCRPWPATVRDRSPPDWYARLAALWTLHASGSLSDQVLAGAATDREWALRAAAARIIGERQNGTPELAVLEQSCDDAEPQVRSGSCCRLPTTELGRIDGEPSAPDAWGSGGSDPCVLGGAFRGRQGSGDSVYDLARRGTDVCAATRADPGLVFGQRREPAPVDGHLGEQGGAAPLSMAATPSISRRALF